MRVSQALRAVVLTFALVAGAILAAPATASPVYLRDGNGGTVFGAAGSKILTIGVNTGAGLRQFGVMAGAFYLQYAPASSPSAWTDFVTYCLEPDELLAVSGIVQGDRQASVAQVADYAGRSTAIARLYGSWFADSLTTAVKTAAFQVALWEIAFDAGHNLGGGLFQLIGSTDDTNAVRKQATAYLTYWTVMEMPGVMVRQGTQDLVMLPTAVPEPAAVMLFGVGLFAVILAMRPWRRA